MVLKRMVITGWATCALIFVAPALAAEPTRPEPIDPASWLMADDYPTEAMRQEREGVVQTRLAVDQTGAVTRCEVIVSSGTSLLDDATCKALSTRGRFKPARDDSGKAVPGVCEPRTVWRMPRTMLRSYLNVTRIVIGADNTVISCENRQSRDAFAGNPCERYGDVSTADQFARQFGAGTLTYVEKQIVDDQLPEGLNFDVSRLPTLARKSQFWSVNGAGKVIACKAYEATAPSATCDGLSEPYEQANDGHTRHVASVTMFALEPAASIAPTTTATPAPR